MATSIRPFPSSRYRIFFLQVVVGTRRREEDLFIKLIYITIHEGSVQMCFKFVGQDEFNDALHSLTLVIL